MSKQSIDADVKAQVDHIMRWLEDPQMHLNNDSRRAKIEAMILLHMNNVVYAERDKLRAESRRQAVKDFLLFGSLISTALTLGALVLEWQK